MVPLHSYPHLGQLKFSSGAFILLVYVTTLQVKLSCGKFNWMGMIRKGTHVLIKCLTANNAYQSKNQALGSKEQSVYLRNRFLLSHRSGEEFRKNSAQKHAVCVSLNGRSLKQPGFFLELASCPNWAIDGEGLWLEWWWRTSMATLFELMIICGDRRNLQKDKHTLIRALWRCGQTQSSLQFRHMKTHLEFTKKQLKKTLRFSGLMNFNSKHHVWRIPVRSSPAEYIPTVKCAGRSLVLWGCFSAAGTEGLVKVEDNLNAPKYWDNLNENPEHSEPQTGQKAYLPTGQWPEAHNSLNVFEWPSQSLSLNPIKYFWRNLKKCICPNPTWQSLRREEVRRRIADNFQMMCKACRIKQKRLETVKMLQLNI